LFGKRTDLTLNAKLTALFAKMGPIRTQMEDWSEDQASGRGERRGGAAERQRLRKVIRASMRDINEIARAMPAEEFPGVKEKFRMPVSNAYHVVLAGARAFVEDAEPIKAAFIERALPATFVDDLDALVTQFASATAMKEAGRAETVGGTAGLASAAASATKTVRELRSCMRYHLRNQPDLLAAWLTASRLQRSAAAAKPAEEPPAGSGAGTGSGGSGT
jgi:hypothetical protein